MNNRKVKIRINDEANCVLIGLSPDHLDYFHHHYSRKAPNFYFHPKYQLGQWDGSISYFHKTGKTFVNLLDEIVPKLVALRYEITVEDLRICKFIQPPLVKKDHFAHIMDPETGEPLELRPYQVVGINAMITNNGGIFKAGTGSGKTICNAALVDAYATYDSTIKTITIVPNTDLVEQTKTDFEYWGLDVGEYTGDCKDTNHTHVISTWQALQNNYNIITQFNLVVVDECHGLKGQVLQKLLNDYGSNIGLRFGLTGTIPKAETDAMSVRICVGEVQYAIEAHELIQQDYLAKLHIDIFQLDENFKDEYDEYMRDNPNAKLTYNQFRDGYFPDYTSEKSYLQKNNERIEWISLLLQTKRDEKKGNVFCLVDGVNFGKKLAKAVPDAIFVYGKDKKKARKEIYNLFKDNDNLVVIATVHIASTGLNIKRIFNLVFIDVGKSFIRVIQTIGRGLRKAPDKDYVNVMDICSNLKYGKKHKRERVKFYNEAKYPHKTTKVDYT